MKWLTDYHRYKSEGQVNYEYVIAVNCILTCIDAMMETPLHQRRVEDCTSGSHVGGVVLTGKQSTDVHHHNQVVRQLFFMLYR